MTGVIGASCFTAGTLGRAVGVGVFGGTTLQLPELVLITLGCLPSPIDWKWRTTSSTGVKPERKGLWRRSAIAFGEKIQRQDKAGIAVMPIQQGRVALRLRTKHRIDPRTGERFRKRCFVVKTSIQPDLRGIGHGYQSGERERVGRSPLDRVEIGNVECREVAKPAQPLDD